jgi:hypothetical protein
VGSVVSNPAYSPEVPNRTWFAIMFSAGIPSSAATGCKQCKEKTDDFYIESMKIILKIHVAVILKKFSTTNIV